MNGAFACGSSDTLVKILRQELGFKGFVTSDWGTVHAAANVINHGLDMEMPGTLAEGNPMGSVIFNFFGTQKSPDTPPPPPDMSMMAAFFGGNLPEEAPAKPGFPPFGSLHDEHLNIWNLMQPGEVEEEAITRAAGRVLYQMNSFGYLDHLPSHTIQTHAVEASYFWGQVQCVSSKTWPEAIFQQSAGAIPELLL